MTHLEIRARLSEYLERDLDPAERSLVEGHLDGCASCNRGADAFALPRMGPGHIM